MAAFGISYFCFMIVVEKELQPKSISPSSAYDSDRLLIAMFIASFHGNYEIVEQLLKLGVKYRKMLPSGREAIVVAVIRGNIRCLELLCKYKHYRS